jgi:hypothetical protein
MKRVSWLAFSVLFVWLVGGVTANLALEGVPVWVPLLAGAICFVPAALTLLLLDRLRTRSPEEKIVATLAAPFLRMSLAGGGGMAAYFAFAPVREHGAAFIAWMVVFYLVTLAVETRLLYIVTSGQAVAEPTNR